MFVQNKTPHPVVLARADVSDDLCVGTVVLRVCHRLSATGLAPWEGLRTPLEHITGLFTCLLRNEIANFRAPAPAALEGGRVDFAL